VRTCNGTCGLACAAGYSQCGGPSCSVNLLTDVNNCGSCNNNCSTNPAFAQWTCNNGVCASVDACSPAFLPPTCSVGTDCFYNGTAGICGTCCQNKTTSAPYCNPMSFCGSTETCCQTTVDTKTCCKSGFACMDNPDISGRATVPQVCVDSAAPCNGITCSGNYQCYAKTATTPACGCCQAPANCVDPINWCERTTTSEPSCCASSANPVNGFVCCDVNTQACLDVATVFALSTSVNLPTPNVCQQRFNECNSPLVVTCPNGCSSSVPFGPPVLCT